MKRFLTLILIIALALGAFLFYKRSDNEEPQSIQQIATLNIGNYDFKSQSIIVINRDKYHIVWNKNIDEQIHASNSSNLLTALLVENHAQKLDELVEIQEDVLQALYQSGATITGFYPHELVSVEDLLTASLITGNKDADASLRHYLQPDAYILKEMNTELIKKIGLYDSTDDYSTVLDIALLTDYLLTYPHLKKQISKKEARTAPTNYHEEGLKLNNPLLTMLDDELRQDSDFLEVCYEGYHPSDGQFLITTAEIMDQEFLIVSAKAPVDLEGTPYHLEDHLYLYEKIEESLNK